MSLAARLATAIAGWHAQAGRPLLVGLGGAQGSGKSWLATRIVPGLADHGLHAATLGLDDLYLPRAQRLALATDVHPLFATRGPPGTHDPALGLQLIKGLLDTAGPVPVPRFSKPLDDRAPATDWPVIAAPLDVLIFEGWCLGATPMPEGPPLNRLEADEDPDGRWRAHINSALAGRYAQLWARIDRLVWLAAPDWETVCRWRAEQEAHSNAGTMDAAALSCFLMHYERITRAQLSRPPLADLILRLAADRSAMNRGGMG